MQLYRKNILQVELDILTCFKISETSQMYVLFRTCHAVL